MKQEDIIKFIKSQRLRWAAHVMRMENTRTKKKIAEWTPYKTRPAEEIQVKLNGPGRRRPKEDENYWLEGEGRGQTGME
jgi:hypothetical protein